MNRKLKNSIFIFILNVFIYCFIKEIYLFCNIINPLKVTFDQFNTFLLNKHIHLSNKNCTDPKCLKGNVYLGKNIFSKMTWFWNIVFLIIQAQTLHV